MVQNTLLLMKMHRNGAFCLPGGKHSAGGLRPPRAVEGTDSVLYRKASQSPHDIFQLAESVIVGNTLPAGSARSHTFDVSQEVMQYGKG